MKDKHIIYGTKPCGCMAVVLTIDHDTDRHKIVRAKRTIQRHGYKLEFLSTEEHKARAWECPEHKAARIRLARDRLARQEEPSLKG